MKDKYPGTLARLRTLLGPSREWEPDWSEATSKAHRAASAFCRDPRFPFTWHDWDDAYNDPVANGHDRTVAQVALDWLIKLPDLQQRWMWWWGRPGRGKTMLARLTALFFYQAYQETIGFCSWTHKLCRLRSRIDDGLEEEQGAGLLVLDDLGSERTTHWELEMLHLLVDGRVTMPTIVTANWSLAQYEGVLAASARRDDHRGAVAMLSEKIIDRLYGAVSAQILFEATASYRRMRDSQPGDRRYVLAGDRVSRDDSLSTATSPSLCVRKTA